MSERTYTVRTMTRDEIGIVLDWAAAEGWNPGLNDAVCYYAADPNGFFIGLLDDEPIAAISAVRYDDTFGFIGFYIVKPEYRGHLRYGPEIGRAGMVYLAGCNIGLDGVVAQQEHYKTFGFKFAYRNIRFEGIGGGEDPDDPDVVALAALPFEMVEAYDAPFFPVPRPDFTRAWIAQPDAYALGIVDDDGLTGYGVIRPCRSGWKIGPLFADDVDKAETLFLTLKSKIPEGDAIFLDTPEVNPAAVALAKKYGMTPMFETARMYTGAFPDLPLERTFGVASFEIG